MLAVGNNFYSPNAVTVSVGTTVTWTWNPGDVSHSVTFDDGPNSGIQSSGTFSRTFDAAGTYHYHCLVHGLAMAGTVTVH
jgi:plastocyanin